MESEEAKTTGPPALDVPSRLRGMGLTSPFQIAMAKHLFDDEEEPDPEDFYLEPATRATFGS